MGDSDGEERHDAAEVDDVVKVNRTIARETMVKDNHIGSSTQRGILKTSYPDGHVSEGQPSSSLPPQAKVWKAWDLKWKNETDEGIISPRDFERTHSGGKSAKSLESIGTLEVGPVHLRTERQRWLCLAATCAACAFASGPVGAWPTIEPLYIKAGIFPNGDEEHTKTCLGTVFSLAVFFQLGGSLPAGWLYDRIGGELCALYGGFGASIGLSFMSVAAYYPEKYSWLLYVGYPLAQFAGQINTYCIFVFIWLLPDHQNLVSSCAGGVQSLSDTVALLAVALSHYHGLSVGAFMAFLAVMSIFAGIAAYLIVPGPTMLKDFIWESLGDDWENDEDEEDVERRDTEVVTNGLPSPRRTWKGEFKAIQTSIGIMKKNPGTVGLLLAFCSVYCLSILYPIEQMMYYYKALFGDSSQLATKLVNAWAIIYGACGFLCALFLGALCDSVGLVQFVGIVSGIAAAVAMLLPIKSFACQILAQLGLTVGISLYIIIVNRFAMLYGSPKHFGTLGGVQFTIVSIVVSLGLRLMSFLEMDGSGVGDAESFQIIFVDLGIGSSVLGCLLGLLWHAFPPPPITIWKHSKYETVEAGLVVED